MRAMRFVLVTLAATVACGAQAGASAPALAPHRAVYDLTLENATDRSGINGISGRMVYEFKGSACEGYSVRFRFVTRIETEETTRLTDQQTTTFESGSGDTFRFATKSFVDDSLDREVGGTATTGEGGTSVVLEKPEKKTLQIAPTQFPTEHLKELLRNARAEKRFYQTTLFDGSEDADEAMMTTVVVGEPQKPSATDPELPALEPIASDDFWPVTIAYFDGSEKTGEETPDYDISFKLHESGVTRDLVMNYGEFSIKGRLVDLSLFEPAKTCETR